MHIIIVFLALGILLWMMAAQNNDTFGKIIAALNVFFALILTVLDFFKLI